MYQNYPLALIAHVGFVSYENNKTSLFISHGNTKHYITW